ncbi:unnamed protein product [Cylindrotheca closterium]|uniref:Uncharacterized protein n=1 Tax=Cylindrotheca closterium TaxID=2856 RepID=A0AAD2CRV0_9STRA|nr:unnamed protein product [Cylindrotheca closterium]
MFLPENLDQWEKEEKERKAAFEKIEAWSLEMIPEEIRKDAFVAVREMACGDPNCSPVDTAVTILFESGIDGIFGVPMMAKDITKEDLAFGFPPAEVLHKWKLGEDVDWASPRRDDYDDDLFAPMLPQDMPALRFDIGQKVLCRTGPDAEKDWSPGTIILQWYHNASWPEGSYAPYKIRLDDDREIFAPADIDQVIKKELPEELEASAEKE